MSFVPNRLLDILAKILSDATYGRPITDEPKVLLHHVAHTHIGQELLDLPYGISPVETDNGIQLKLNGRIIHFIRSYDIPEDKVYIFFETDIITITH